MKTSLGKEFSTNLYFVLAVLIFVVLGCVNPKAGNSSNSNTESNHNSAPANKLITIEESDDFKKLSSAEHLAEAKKLYNNKPSDYELYVTSLHLKTIPETAPEYREAQTILKQIEKTIDVKKEDKKKYADALQVVSSSWRKGAFGVAGIWTVTFYNKSDKPIRDIEYQTRYYSETGNDLGGTGGLFTSGEVQKMIPPRLKRTVKINDGFINKEAAKAAFKVTNWRFIEQ